MKKTLSVLCFLLLLLLPALVMADCASINFNNGIRLDIPCADYGGERYELRLDFYNNPSDPGSIYFKLSGIESSNAGTSCASIDAAFNLNITCAELQNVRYTLLLTPYVNADDRDGFYWKMVSAEIAGNNDNRKPVADSISLTVDSTIPYIVQQLSARDPDNDVLQYELVSPVSGTGYADAYVNPSSGKLYLTHSPEGNNSFSVSFRVTDGRLFSDAATVSVQVGYLSEDSKNTGRNDVDAEVYSRFDLSTYNSNLLGLSGDQPISPRSVDLSPNFPVPGDQGNQNSCVGWATAYAVKSYHEKIEMGWALNTPQHLFSPAFLYNQINYGRNQGSYINEALDLAVNKGIATLSTMPYSDRDYVTQPSQASFSEAIKFKAASWRRVNDTSQIKAALANGRPVIGGIAVYEQLMQLSGANSLYNTASGSNQGGHAITIVGYDDDRYGGAFKVINSWGQTWGEQGFFWMPYDFAASGILSEAYVLEDAKNNDTIVPTEPTQPEPDQNRLANLTVETWNASYDPRPRGNGSLTYSIKNTGSGTASAGIFVTLMLSEDADFSLNDYMVVYEVLPELQPGGSVYRDQNNAIEFNFPDRLNSGTYYMALVVDPMNVMDETIKTDNVSPGDTPIVFQNNLPDLSVNTWYAEWDALGNGTLTYEVINTGASSTTSMDWEINLILDRDQIIGNGNEIYLFYEPTQYILEPDSSIYRDEWSAASFNLYQTYNGDSVPSGIYYIALWVDDLNVEAESNELNNGSYSWGTVLVGGNYWWGSGNPPDQEPEDSLQGTMLALSKDIYQTKSAYNGRKLPKAKPSWKRVEISSLEDGMFSIKTLHEQPMPQKGTGIDLPGYTKTISAHTKVIFPTTSRIKMQ